VHSLEPIAPEKFKRFLEYVLCESRGSRYGRAVYWRGDIPYPIQFREDYLVPVTEIKICLKALGMTIEQYLSILDRLYPNE